MSTAGAVADGEPAVRPTLRVTGSPALRLAGLALTALLVIAALAASLQDLQTSGRLVLLTAVLAVLAPLFWPGGAEAPRASAWRVLGWSLAVALLGAIAAFAGAGTASAVRIATACAMLLLVCIVTHGLAAILETQLAGRRSGVASARETAAWLATAMLATLGAAPLWLGPVAELATPEHPGAVDAAVAASPLTHLAVASGNDLFRNQWFYQHSNLAGLRFDYPRMAPLVGSYAALAAILLLIPAFLPRRPKPTAPASRQPDTEGHTP
jgi:hypothetical protein